MKEINGTKAKFSHKGKEYEISLEGVRKDTLMELALMGAIALLKQRVDPGKSWEEIIKKGLHKPKSYPRIVLAISAVQGVSEDEALAIWASASDSEKSAYRSNPKVKIKMIELKHGIDSK